MLLARRASSLTLSPFVKSEPKCLAEAQDDWKIRKSGERLGGVQQGRWWSGHSA